MAFLGIDNRRDLPKVSYSTALDYFVAISFVFVLATVIQFAGVHYFTKHGSGEELPDSDEEEEEEDVEQHTDLAAVSYHPTYRHKQCWADTGIVLASHHQ